MSQNNDCVGTYTIRNMIALFRNIIMFFRFKQTSEL